MFTITSRHAVKVWMRPQCYCYCSLSICFAMRNLDPGYEVVQSRVCCPTSSEPSLWDHATHGFWGTGYRPKRVWYSFNLNIKCVLWNIHINGNIQSIQSSVYGLRTHITYVRGGVSSFVDLWARNWGWPLAHCDFMHGACVRNEEKMLGILIDCLIIRNRPSPSQVCGSVVILIYY
jgi:hypothetical protein